MLQTYNQGIDIFRTDPRTITAQDTKNKLTTKFFSFNHIKISY